MNWEKAGRCLFESAGDSWLSPRVASSISDPELDLYVACSGGADSVFLALWTWAFRAESAGGASVSLLHFNHKLRGEDSDQDAVFVEGLASSLGCPFVVDSWVREKSDEERVSEGDARDARMAFFERATAGSEQSIILTAHHAGDVVETMLMRLSRGSGLQGLSAPRLVSEGPGGIVFGRPLLSFRKEFLLESLRSVGASWREDASNGSEDFYRNRLRKNVIPLWRDSSDRDLERGVGLSRELIEEDGEALERWADEAWENLNLDEGEISFERLRAFPRGMRRRLLQRIADRLSGGACVLGLENADAVLGAVERGEALVVSLGATFFLRLEGRRIRFESRKAPVIWDSFRLPLGVYAFLPNGGRIRSRCVKMGKELLISVRNGEKSDNFSVFTRISPKQAASLSVRTWRAGDAYAPVGRRSKIKLKKLFNDRKLPFVWRREAPVFETPEGEVLWVPGLPLNNSHILGPDATHALQLTYEE